VDEVINGGSHYVRRYGTYDADLECLTETNVMSYSGSPRAFDDVVAQRTLLSEKYRLASFES
jgi:hypothetical protein